MLYSLMGYRYAVFYKVFGLILVSISEEDTVKNTDLLQILKIADVLSTGLSGILDCWTFRQPLTTVLHRNTSCLFISHNCYQR